MKKGFKRLSDLQIREGFRNKNRIFYGLLPNRGGVSEGSEKTILAILVFSAFGHRDLAKQVTLKVRLSGNLNSEQ